MVRTIAQRIKDLFTKEREPFPTLPGILIACSLGKRPGLSTIQSTANIVNALAKLGIPTGVMPDGSPNLTIGNSYAIVNEVFRAFKFDLNIQAALQPSSLNVVVAGGTGANVTTGNGNVILN